MYLLEISIFTEESAYRSTDYQGNTDENEFSNYQHSASTSNTKDNSVGTRQLGVLLEHQLNSQKVDVVRDCCLESDQKSPVSSKDADDSVTSNSRHDSTTTSGSGGSMNSSFSSLEYNSTRLYKFKSNLKHRFNGDMAHKGDGQSASKVRRLSDSLYGNEVKGENNGDGSQRHRSTQRESHESFPPKELENKKQSIEDWQEMATFHSKEKYNGAASRTVEGDEESLAPIFAPSENGSFYTPQNIPQSQIAAGMNIMEESSSMLHPVLIYVKVSPPVQHASAFNRVTNSKYDAGSSAHYNALSHIDNTSHDRMRYNSQNQNSLMAEIPRLIPRNFGFEKEEPIIGSPQSTIMAIDSNMRSYGEARLKDPREFRDYVDTSLNSSVNGWLQSQYYNTISRPYPAF